MSSPSWIKIAPHLPPSPLLKLSSPKLTSSISSSAVEAPSAKSSSVLKAVIVVEVLIPSLIHHVIVMSSHSLVELPSLHKICSLMPLEVIGPTAASLILLPPSFVKVVQFFITTWTCSLISSSDVLSLCTLLEVLLRNVKLKQTYTLLVFVKVHEFRTTDLSAFNTALVFTCIVLKFFPADYSVVCFIWRLVFVVLPTVVESWSRRSWRLRSRSILGFLWSWRNIWYFLCKPNVNFTWFSVEILLFVTEVLHGLNILVFVIRLLSRRWLVLEKLIAWKVFELF